MAEQSLDEPWPENGTSLVDFGPLKPLCLQFKQYLSDGKNELFDELNQGQRCKLTVDCRKHLRNASVSNCPPTIREVTDVVRTCFAETRPGDVAVSSCPSSLNGLPYDDTQNVTLGCLENGTWEKLANYSRCKPIINQEMLCPQFGVETSPLKASELDACESTATLLWIFYVGQGLSLLALSATFFLFCMLRSVRCWRNIIHWNLTASLILKFLAHFISLTLNNSDVFLSNEVWCCMVTTLLVYAQLTNFFWMFVEGIYLHMMVVLAYTYDRINIKVYLAVGWGFPLPIVLAWAILKSQYENVTCWMKRHEKVVDYVYQIPIFLVLAINSVILGNIVRILVTKIRSEPRTGVGADSQPRQYIKAVKAAFFLLPLLGATYILFLVSPEEGTTGRQVFLYFNTIMQSLQGVLVCAIYCFSNTEIQTAVKQKFWKWRLRRGFRNANHRMRMTQKNSWSRTSFSSMFLRRGSSRIGADHRDLRRHAAAPRSNRRDVGTEVIVMSKPSSRSPPNARNLAAPAIVGAPALDCGASAGGSWSMLRRGHRPHDESSDALSKESLLAVDIDERV